MDVNSFNKIMSNAQRLMLDDNFNAIVEQKANKGGGIPNVDFSSLEKQAFGYVNENTTQQTYQQQPQMNEKVLSKLPKALRESFQKTPPMSGDNIDTSPMGILEQNLSKNVKPSTLNESQTRTNNTGNLDYTILKGIINECIKENLSSIQKSLINENTVKAFRIGNGNKIQFLDKSGNLYEGTLTLKKRKQ